MRKELENWRNDLEAKLKKRFYENEILDIISYYEEMIEERIANDEDINEILKDYDPKIISKKIVPEIVSKRNDKSVRQVSRSALQITAWIFSSPVLIPLGIVYVVFVMVLGIMAFCFALIPVSVLFYQIMVFVNRGMYVDVSILQIFGGIGLSLIAIALTGLLSIVFVKLFLKAIKGMVKVFAKLLGKKNKKEGVIA